MQKIDLNATVSKKTGLIVIISIIIAVIAAMIGIAAGHIAYENSTKTEITNISDFTETTPKIYIYGYADGKVSVNISDIIQISENATFSILSVKEKAGEKQFNIIDKSGNTVVDVSNDVAKYVTVEITNGRKSSQYMLVLVAKSNEANTILAHNTTIDGNFLDVYNTTEDYILPTPSKSFESDVCTYAYDFEGWYTSSDYSEGTEIDIIPAGSSGLVELYAKFKTTSMAQGTDGKYYYTMGVYPQTKISNYAYLGVLRTASEAVANSTTFTCDPDGNGTSETYFKFKPTNTINVADNGYSSSSTYFFLVEPIEWIVLTTGTPTTGSSYQLLARKIINCNIFVDQNAASIFEGLGDTYQTLIENYAETFLESIYGPESLWYKSGAKDICDAMYSSTTWLTTAEIASLTSRSYTAYYTEVNLSLTDLSLNVIPDEINVSDEKIYCLQYTDMTNTSYGFSADEYAYDASRRAQVTDFAKANGAYYVTNERYTNVGSYFLRGAGGNYTYEDKRFAYVKYSGAVHCYTATSWSIRSGIRPTCLATCTF